MTAERCTVPDQISMPPHPASIIKRRMAKAGSPADGDHRKRRRNRTTQSCLSCHAAKRMCDRKRPCSRCTQLGLTGLCVYEIDDSSIQGESSRLLSRIAELESVVRELRNRPHPRWIDVRDLVPLHFSPASQASTLMNPAYEDIRPPQADWSYLDDIAWPKLLGCDSGSSVSSCDYSPESTAYPLPSPSRRPELSTCCDRNGIVQNKTDPSYDFMSETACYTVALELAPHLHRAAASLALSLNHCFESPCSLTAKIFELQSFIEQAARNNYVCSSINEVVQKQQSNLKSLASRDPFMDENGLPTCDDSFMSCVPAAVVECL
ncbi:hypothetical protein B0H15DRAFT_849214 [Mycena belliarum]|uniref:Zn(2)-C6 fungal-type domain-containing protein n=1 Tax=Mycena belliarum TaxID=1033014 RepID=A0AAD6XSK6_9AGAR|nr:hypothetical protein B0H15DRAFT_849214 [Mycena belliae]